MLRPSLVLAGLLAIPFPLTIHAVEKSTDGEPVPADVPAEKPVPPPVAIQPVVIKEKDIPKRDIVNSSMLAKHPIDARQIILEAHLDDNLRDGIGELSKNMAGADGRVGLGNYITVLNGAAMVDFVLEHGYKAFHGPVEIRKWPGGRLEVDVRITAPNGKSMLVILQADGSIQGRG